MDARPIHRTTLVGLLAAGLLAAGCGGGDDGGTAKPAAPAGDNDPAATQVAQRYVDAYTQKKAPVVCRLLAAQVREQLEASGSCVATVKKSFAAGKNPKLTAVRSFVKGDVATVTFKGVERQVQLAREPAGWRVTNGGT
jgi:hypothetical protein